MAVLVLVLVLAGCNLSNTPQATPSPTPALPTVQFLYPANESTVTEGTDMEIQIMAADTGIGVARVELYVDDELVNEHGPDISAAVPTFTVLMNWLASGQGRHSLTAIAYRPDGVQSDEARVLVNVLPPDGDLMALTAQPTATTP